MSHDSPTLDSARRWWLAIDGRPDGPHAADYVSTALQAGRLTATSLVCLQGDREWKPLTAWPELSALVASATPPPLPRFASRAAARDERLLTNESLPPSANLICIYAIVVVPLYWMFGVAMLLREDNPFLEGTGGYLAYGVNLFFNLIVTLALTVGLAIGGIRFRDLRASGEWLIRLTLCVWSAWIVMQIFLQIGLLIVGSATETLDDSSDGVSAWDVFQLFISLTAWCCDIVAMAWLFRRRENLPLDSNR